MIPTCSSHTRCRAVNSPASVRCGYWRLVGSLTGRPFCPRTASSIRMGASSAWVIPANFFSPSRQYTSAFMRRVSRTGILAGGVVEVIGRLPLLARGNRSMWLTATNIDYQEQLSRSVYVKPEPCAVRETLCGKVKPDERHGIQTKAPAATIR